LSETLKSVTKMGNRLAVGELIGEGQYSKVFRGNYQGSRVAIKKVNIVSEQFKDAGRQHEAMKKLDHSYVLKLFHWEDQNEFRLITIQFIWKSPLLSK
jgi:RIO-like serine/threonine protein kinase